MMAWIISILITTLIIYFAIAIVFYLFQDFFFFRPEKLPHNFQYKYPFPFEEVKFDMEDGGYINGIYFEIPNSLGVVYYLKGNSKSIKGWGKFAKDFVGKGYDFFMVDYRGFGKSKGKRSEQILFDDAQHIYNSLRKKYGEERIIVIGRSFGSGIAARVASWNHPKMLILDSPYYSFQKLVERWGFWLPLRWILRYKIKTNQFLKSAEFPIHIIHGDKDILIPYKHSVQLEKEFPQAIELHTVPGGHHNDLPEFSKYHNILYEILTSAHHHPDIK